MCTVSGSRQQITKHANAEGVHDVLTVALRSLEYKATPILPLVAGCQRRLELVGLPRLHRPHSVV